MKRTLRDIFEDHAHYGSDAGHADKGSTHSYIEEYERLLAPYRDGSTFMEIGLAMGESLKMWCEYFSNSHIVGVDISIVFDVFSINCNSTNFLHTIEADATKPEFLEWFGKYKVPQKFDVVIDDGGHLESQQVATFNLLKPLMTKNSLYFVEDILNIDASRARFEALHDNCEVIDLRNVKGRFDDCLIVYRF